MYTNAKGRYFGGLNNVTAIDLFDVPGHDDEFDSIAAAADREMLAILAEDRDTRITAKAVREFVSITDEVAA